MHRYPFFCRDTNSPLLRHGHSKPSSLLPKKLTTPLLTSESFIRNHEFPFELTFEPSASAYTSTCPYFVPMSGFNPTYLPGFVAGAPVTRRP